MMLLSDSMKKVEKAAERSVDYVVAPRDLMQRSTVQLALDPFGEVASCVKVPKRKGRLDALADWHDSRHVLEMHLEKERFFCDLVDSERGLLRKSSDHQIVSL
mmetsp:Transcript_34723/g.50980  ORF Transcript_34723/g.50980 Transcript_34723/m.50980 type:complete len:103 (+) Transcript_34723:738-1046(+)